MIAYDVSMFNQYAAIASKNTKLKEKLTTIKRTLKTIEERHKDVNAELVKNEERHLFIENQLNFARVTINKLQQKFNQTRKTEKTLGQAFMTAESLFTTIISQTQRKIELSNSAQQFFVIFPQHANTEQSTIMKWKALGSDSSEKLIGTDKQIYELWAYSMKEKLNVDASLYFSERRKMNYVIKQLKELIFQFMIS